jgi:hypothetical protein
MRAAVEGELEWTLIGALGEILAITALLLGLALIFMRRRLFK